jgi:predicted TIM-barrel fold metal-dependent hydrolase
MLEDLLDVLDRSDEDLRFVISCDFPYLTNIGRDPAAIMVGNRFIYDLVRRAPNRLYGSCTINPNFLDESLRVMKISFEEWGFVMLGEMLQYSMNYRMNSDAAEKVVRLAVHYDVPIQVHLGTYWHRKAGSSGAGMDHLADLLGIAERLPEAKYILAHAIGCGPTPDYVPWADMFLDALAGVFPKYPMNFWIEIRDFQCRALKRTLAEVPSERLLAGTDWTTRIGPPFQSYGTMFDVPEGKNPFPPRVASFKKFLRDAGASDETIVKVAFKNALDLFKLAS